MNMTRRDMLKLSGVTAVAAATVTLTGCASEPKPACDKEGAASGKKAIKHQIVVIGGGFGGLTIAKQLKKLDSALDVAVLEKNDRFMSCPFSNTYLGKIEGVTLGTLVHDYAQPVESHGYKMIQCEVTGIDRTSKTVYTSKGPVKYEILVMSPGIAYNYEKQFPNWDEAKIERAKRATPAALIPGGEHIALERLLVNMDDGNVVITVPAGKYRCPPAPFERASMIAAYMKKEEIEGKVIILNETEEISKGAAFKESWKELYDGIVEHHSNCKIDDIDFDKKEITYTQLIRKNEEDLGTKEKKTIKYQVFNFIPHNKANPIVAMSGVETTSDSFGKVKMNGISFRTLSDENIYAIGDVVEHNVPPSGQTAIWTAKECAKEIVGKLQGKPYDIKSILPYKVGNVCYSMVGDNPEEAIMVTHDFMEKDGVIFGKGSVPKDPITGKFRTANIGKATRDWYRGAMADMFN